MTQQATAEEFYDAGSALIQAQRWEEAEMAFQKAVLIKPSYPAALNNRGNVLQCLNRHFDATMNYSMALTYDPGSADIYNNRGAAYAGLDHYTQAEIDYRKAIELRGNFEQALTNLGNVLKLMGRVEESRGAYAKAVEANPAYVDAHLNRSFVELESGNFKLGWEEYEWRWKSGQIPVRNFHCPVWNGEDLHGKSIILYGEQGLGDALQFIRYAAIIKEMGAREVVVEVRAPLARIAKTVPGVDRAFVHGEEITGQIDYNCALMGLPRILGMTLDTIPNKVPYLSYPEPAFQMWKERLSALPGIKVGIVWAGSPRPMQPASNAVDKRRSTFLSQWGPIAAVRGVTFVSLQKEAAADQGRYPPPGMTLANWSNELDDITDTAALIANLDLVIAVDTAIVHLAGALAKPVWMLSRHDNCWRWLGRRQDSPWYPTLKQFIQPNPGNWQPVFEDAALELKKFVIEKSHVSQAAAA